jgi:hypothetical protein
VADEKREPVVVDWRAPVAEPFYRATGREPMGLARRRHFAVEGRKLLGIEDELFGEGHLGVGHDEGLDRPTRMGAGSGLRATARSSRRSSAAAPAPSATSSPPSRPSRTRSSARPRPGCWWSRVAPAPARPWWRCTVPRTCSTRFRFPLEDQGVLVIGPNRVFLRYIERVLPSLGEAGVEQVVLPISSPTCASAAATRPSPRGPRATPGCPT